MSDHKKEDPIVKPKKPSTGDPIVKPDVALAAGSEKDPIVKPHDPIVKPHDPIVKPQ